MDSPDTIPFQSFIQIDRKSNTAIYLQIVTQMINAIQRQYLYKGMKLPGTRVLSKILNVNRNTLVLVYEELASLGWIEIIPNKGTFILAKEENVVNRIKNTTPVRYTTYPNSTGFRFKKSMILDTPFETPTYSFILNDGSPDLRLLPIQPLAKLYSTSLKRKKNIDWAFHESKDFFKSHLSNFLNLTRGLHITKKNMLVARSIETCLYISSEILISPGDKVIVGELSYFLPNMIFQKAGAQLLTVPIDKEGILIEPLKHLCKKNKIRMLYLTPHHHYPTTATLSAERRIALLELSTQYGFIILEDDYDYDFNYTNSRTLPLASADKDGMVVYIGSFGRSLAPGFRSGFIIAPQNLIHEMNKLLGIIDRQGDVFMDLSLGEMIEEGEIYRHLKKSTYIYKERRDSLTQLLSHHFKNEIRFTPPSGGLATWIEWNSPINLMQIRENCKKENIFIPKSLLYQSKKVSALRMGFGNFSTNELEMIIEKLKFSSYK